MSAVILAADNVGQYYADTSDKEDQQPTSTNKQSKNINSYIMDNSMIMTTRSSATVKIEWVGGHYHHSRSLGTNQKPVCDFLLVVNTN